MPAPDAPILVVDDDPKIVTLVRTYLERERFPVITAGDGPAALRAIERRPAAARGPRPDAPRPRWPVGHPARAGARRDPDPRPLGARLDRRPDPRPERGRRRLPAEALLARRARRPRPHDPAPNRAAPRRTRWRPTSCSSAATSSSTRAATRRGSRGRPVPLSALELRLLAALLDADGRALTRDQLLDGIHGAGEGDVLDRAIDVYIKRLREKLGDDANAPRYVATVRGVGYRAAGRVDGDPRRRRAEPRDASRTASPPGSPSPRWSSSPSPSPSWPSASCASGRRRSWRSWPSPATPTEHASEMFASSVTGVVLAAASWRRGRARPRHDPRAPDRGPIRAPRRRRRAHRARATCAPPRRSRAPPRFARSPTRSTSWSTGSPNRTRSGATSWSTPRTSSGPRSPTSRATSRHCATAYSRRTRRRSTRCARRSTGWAGSPPRSTSSPAPTDDRPMPEDVDLGASSGTASSSHAPAFARRSIRSTSSDGARPRRPRPPRRARPGHREPAPERAPLHAAGRPRRGRRRASTAPTPRSGSRTAARRSRPRTCRGSGSASSASNVRATARPAAPGIGLAIVKRLVEEAGGRVGASSERGRHDLLVQPSELKPRCRASVDVCNGPARRRGNSRGLRALPNCGPDLAEPLPLSLASAPAHLLARSRGLDGRMPRASVDLGRARRALLDVRRRRASDALLTLRSQLCRSGAAPLPSGLGLADLVLFIAV